MFNQLKYNVTMKNLKNENLNCEKESYEAPVVECVEMVIENACLVSSVNTEGNEPWDIESGFWDEV